MKRVKRVCQDFVAGLAAVLSLGVILGAVLGAGWLVVHNGLAIRGWFLMNWWVVVLAVLALWIARRREGNLRAQGFREGAVFAARLSRQAANHCRLADQMVGGFVKM